MVDETNEKTHESKGVVLGRHEEQIVFVTRRGYHLQLRAVSSWLINDALGDAAEPEVPTYEVESRAGIQVFQHYHDPNNPEASTLKTDEDRAAWEEYEVKQKEYFLERNRVILDLYIHEGIVDPPMPTQEWKDRMARYKTELPSDENDLLIYFYEREVFGSQSDMVEFMLAIMQAGGDVSEERVASIATSFRRTLSKLTNVALSNTEGRMVVQPDTGKGEGGEVLGSDKPDTIREFEPDGQGNNDSGLPDRLGDAII